MTVFADAASLLASEPLPADRDEAARSVLAALQGEDPQHLSAMLRVAKTMPRLFELASPLAPGLVCIGGSVERPIGGEGASMDVSGKGLDFRSAWVGCIGEAIECLSLERAGSSWGGAGCAAAPTLEAATLAGLLELVERDAAALWWIGGRRARLLAAEQLAAAGADALLSTLRQGGSARHTWFLDLTTDLQVPCVAALSVDRAGTGLAIGLAARPSVADAAKAALLELCQMELAGVLASHKEREGGSEALSDADRRHLRRASIRAAEHPILAGAGFAPGTDGRAPPDSAGQLAWVSEQLAAHALEYRIQDLTIADIAVPCIRADAPGLQSLDARLETERLARIRAISGGNPLYTQGTELI